jgi:hypothetical protein
MAMQLSATSLQDYVDCPRRFQLRYVLELPWPVLETNAPDDQEQRARLGHDLHQMIHQHLAGLPVASLAAVPTDSPLPAWWQAFLAFAARWQNWQLVPEVTLSAPLAGQRLSVRYDALAWPKQADTSARRCVILEWKTFRRPPKRAWLQRRLQSRVYPWALAHAGWTPPDVGRPLVPDALEMHYWLAGPPARVERFAYSQAALESDDAFLEDLVTRIKRRIDLLSAAGEADRWELTDRRHLCEVCTYRSLCGRGGPAGAPADQEGEDSRTADVQIDVNDADSGWSQVQETVF